MNNVSKYRAKSKLSQRALAALVGVSQQTIQRIETEAVTVRFETAVALASVLKAPLKSLFPDMRDRAALERREPQKSDETIDYSYCSHTLKMAFAGGPMRCYFVDQATASRVRNCLLDEKEFVAFNTDTHSVVVNSRKLLWTNLLFDPGVIGVDEEEGESAALAPLIMYFDGSAEPHTFHVDPDDQIIEDDEEGVGSQLQMISMNLDAFGDDAGILSFLDQDGEEVVFSPARMKALEIPLAITNPKLLEAVFQGMEEDEAAEEAKAAAKAEAGEREGGREGSGNPNDKAANEERPSE